LDIGGNFFNRFSDYFYLILQLASLPEMLCYQGRRRISILQVLGSKADSVKSPIPKGAEDEKKYSSPNK